MQILPQVPGAHSPALSLSALAGFAGYHASRFRTEGNLLDARLAGELLILGKQALVHGEFMSWVENVVGIPRQESQLYMRLVRLWDPVMYQQFAFLSGRAALRRMTRSHGRRELHRYLPNVKDRFDAAANDGNTTTSNVVEGRFESANVSR